MSAGGDTPRRGRPEATSREEIAAAAFRLFARDGYAETAMAAIAAEVGVGERTIFRYFPSKHDIAWGDFSAHLDAFAAMLEEAPRDVPVAEAVQRTMARVNLALMRHADDLALRMRLILREPTLQAHSAMRYAEWRMVIQRYVAGRLGVAPTDPLPQVAGHVCNTLAIAAYSAWVDDPTRDIAASFADADALLRQYLQV